MTERKGHHGPTPVDAEQTLHRLWQRAQRERFDSDEPDPMQVQRLAQRFGREAMECVGDSLAQRRPELVVNSADMLQSLLSLWAVCGLSPDEIWIELHKREQLGSLLMQLNQAKSSAPRRLLKPWRVDSTKLP